MKKTQTIKVLRLTKFTKQENKVIDLFVKFCEQQKFKYFAIDMIEKVVMVERK